MEFELDFGQRALVDEVDRVLSNTSPEGDLSEIFLRLGHERLLAVHWPEKYGGRALRPRDAAAVSERLGELGIADVPHLVSIQAVGCTILDAGTDQQRRDFLPALAGGRLFASLLFSERSAGSDLAHVQTTALRRGTGVFELHGEKTWSLYTPLSRIALCSVRTDDVGNRYNGLTLFLVPLDDPKVEILEEPAMSAEAFHTVRLHGVSVTTDAIVGRLNRAWPLLLSAISYERAGFDYVTRAKRWLSAAGDVLNSLPPVARARAMPAFLALEQRLHAARAMAYTAVTTVDGLELDDVASAKAKIAASETAQQVAWWAAEILSAAEVAGGRPPRAAVLTLERALAEAPGLSVSGGPTEILLDLVGADLAGFTTLR